ncbi:MAG TPA: metalloregulator ArsR/SmtB family transcription factor [Pirellulaceae bacterium]|nr:metalloregulator ArsR/SmtB family transcription factor [Pirellulaceae bacterium]
MKDSISSDQCADMLKALADAERLRLIQALRERAQSVSDLAALLDNDIGNISHHLKVLRRRGIVTTVRQGKQVIYSLSDRMQRGRAAKGDRLDLGCCCLELPRRS